MTRASEALKDADVEADSNTLTDSDIEESAERLIRMWLLIPTQIQKLMC